MDSNTQELDFFDFPRERIQSRLWETIERILSSNNYKMNVSLATKFGENNFIGIIYRISLVDETMNMNDQKSTYNLIAKIAPYDLEHRNIWCPRPCFIREIYMYDEVLPLLRQFEESRGLTNDHCFDAYPKCFSTLDVNLEEFILLEDLSARGFEMLSLRTTEITAEHVRLVMQSLGKLHAISFALKDQHPDKFSRLQSTLMPVFSRDSENQKRLFRTKSLQLMQVVSSDEDEYLLNKLKKIFESEAADIATKCSDPKMAGVAAVILHGDTWQNNFMFRNDDRGKPIEVMLLDWQLSQCASPVNDLSFFLFSSTSKTLRDVHYEDFLKVYHESLVTHMRKLGSNPEILFPFQLMQKHFKQFSRFALMLVSILLPNLITESDKLHDRLRDIIFDMVRLEYI